MIKNKLCKRSKEKSFFPPAATIERMDCGWRRAFMCKVSISDFVHGRIADV